MGDKLQENTFYSISYFLVDVHLMLAILRSIDANECVVMIFLFICKISFLSFRRLKKKLFSIESDGRSSSDEKICLI